MFHFFWGFNKYAYNLNFEADIIYFVFHFLNSALHYRINFFSKHTLLDIF